MGNVAVVLGVVPRVFSVHRQERSGEGGDVPGWVMITVMTAGLVAALWAVAGPELARMLRDALNSVS